MKAYGSCKIQVKRYSTIIYSRRKAQDNRCGKIVLDMDMFPKPLGEDSLCPWHTSKEQ